MLVAKVVVLDEVHEVIGVGQPTRCLTWIVGIVAASVVGALGVLSSG